MESSGGSLMQVAEWLYSDAERWPKIWVANRDAVADPWAVPNVPLVIKFQRSFRPLHEGPPSVLK